MSEKVRVHLKERSPLQDESGQDDLGQIHADTDLEQSHDF